MDTGHLLSKEALFLMGWLKGLGMQMATKAIYFMAEAHKGQKRDDGRDYAEHPTRIARMLLSLGVRDEATVIAALHHDTVEDGRTTLQTIREKFGDDVALLVDLLTKNKNMSAEEYQRNLRRDKRAVLIKAADRLCNVEDMVDVFTSERLARYIKETEDVIIPMMKWARREFPEYTDILIILRDSINAILRVAKKLAQVENMKAGAGA